MMAPKLYGGALSPAVRATLMAIKALDLDVEIVPVNLGTGEHMTPEFLKMNPMHTVPTLKDGDYVLWDSHAINIYLIEKYHPETDLYPKNIEKRSTIHQRLFFDTGILSARSQAIVGSILREGAKTVSKEKAGKLTEGYNFFESLLEGSVYAAGDNLTIADFNLIGTILTCNFLVPIASNRYPNITEWMSNMEKLPYYQETMQVGHEQLTGFLKSKMA